ACASAGPVPLDRVRRRRPGRGRSAPATRCAQQRRILVRPRLRPSAGHDHAPGLEGARRGGGVGQIADLLAAPAGARRMKIAAAKYAIQAPRDFEAFAARQRALLSDAARAGAELAVLPEYLSLE